MIINQIRSTDGTGTLSYLITDEVNRVAILIDPNKEDTQQIIQLAKEQKVSITHIIDTHTHADHVSGANEIKHLFQSQIVMHENTKNKWKVVDLGDKFGIGDILRANAAISIDRYVLEGDCIESGNLKCSILFTPGHSDNHITPVIENNLFTGDLMLIGQAGRSDLPSGNAEEQYESIFSKILKFPDNTKIYPGHDYEANTYSLLGNEKKSNPFLEQRTKQEYIQFVSDFFPPLAESTEGGKVTLQCGTQRVVSETKGPFRNISAKELNDLLQENPSLYMLDVREPFELRAFGAIANVHNISIQQIMKRMNELPQNKQQEIIVVCQSGGRSFEVAHYLSKQGYTNVFNLENGTSGWIQAGYPVEKK